MAQNGLEKKAWPCVIWKQRNTKSENEQITYFLNFMTKPKFAFAILVWKNRKRNRTNLVTLHVNPWQNKGQWINIFLQLKKKKKTPQTKNCHMTTAALLWPTKSRTKNSLFFDIRLVNYIFFSLCLNLALIDLQQSSIGIGSLFIFVLLFFCRCCSMGRKREKWNVNSALFAATVAGLKLLMTKSGSLAIFFVSFELESGDFGCYWLSFFLCRQTVTSHLPALTDCLSKDSLGLLNF